MPQVPYELTQGLNVVNPGIREGVDVKTYPNLQAEQMVESGRQMVHSGTNLKIMMDQVMLDRSEAEAKSHDSQIADTLRVKLYDSNTGFTTFSGQAALDRREQAIKEINDYKKDYISKIKDPFVAQLVSRAADTRLQHAYQTIDTHTSSQGKVYEASASAARIDTLNNDMAALHANNGDPVQLASLRVTRDREIESLAKKQGLVNKDGEVDRSNPLFIAMMSSVETKLVRDMVTNSVTQDNPAKARAKAAAWQKANPEARRIISQNRRARKLANGGKLSKGLSAKLFKLQKGKCPCCNQPLGDDYHMDHIMPLAKGGANEDLNIQLLRQQCNQQKSAKDPIEFMQSRGKLL